MSEIKKDSIVSGMRPTGALHIGHYVGAIKNWINFQDTHSCYFFVADWHALTSNYTDLSVIKKARIEYVRGWLASGLDPKKVAIYNQSWIPEVSMLFHFFLTMTPPGWADRSPSWKDLSVNPNKTLDNLGFYTYPILQAADIAILRGAKVPVGEDQLTHLEITREIIRKFNRTFNADLPEPEAILSEVPKLSGIDGNRKMSSSLNNVITLRETEKSLQKKVNKIKTDDERGGIEKPGNPENCSVFEYHQVFSEKKLTETVNISCRDASLSCGECKKLLGNSMKEQFIPIADKMNSLSDDECLDVLKDGTARVKKEIERHWGELSTKIGFN